jgi:hypothetical protein
LIFVSGNLERSMSRLSYSQALLACLIASMLSGAASPASAATYSWLTRSGTGDWTIASNWNLNSSYPGANAANFDQAHLQGDVTNNLNVNLDTSVSISGLSHHHQHHQQ